MRKDTLQNIRTRRHTSPSGDGSVRMLAPWVIALFGLLLIVTPINLLGLSSTTFARSSKNDAADEIRKAQAAAERAQREMARAQKQAEEARRRQEQEAQMRAEAERQRQIQEQQRQAEQQRAEAERQRQQQERERQQEAARAAERQHQQEQAEQRRAEAERQRQQAQAQREAERQQAQAQKEAERQQAQAQREAERQQAQAQKEAERQARQAQREAERQDARSQRQAEREQNQQQAAPGQQQAQDQAQQGQSVPSAEAAQAPVSAANTAVRSDGGRRDDRQEPSRQTSQQASQQSSQQTGEGTRDGETRPGLSTRATPEEAAAATSEREDAASGDEGRVDAGAPQGAIGRGPSKGVAGLATASNVRFDEGANHELVAVNLNTAEVSQVAALGLTVGPVTVAGTGATVQRFRVPAGMSREDARRMLTRQMPLTKFVPNHVYHIFQGSFGKEGDLGASGAAGGSPAGYGGALIKWTSGLASCTRNVKVGIIDTSFDTTHPAFRHMKARNGEFLDGEKPSPYDWHGTAVLSLLAGDPKSSTPGLIPDATFFLATAFRSDESGNASTDSVRLLAALKWLEELDVDFVNMSFSGPRDALFEAAIQRMRKKGIVFIAAAGNLGPTAPPSYPAAYPEVIAVTAVDSNGVNYTHANRGSYIDVSAPGVDVLAALPEGKQGFRTGTSFATPFVTALVATRSGERTLSRRKVDLLREFRMQDLGPPGPDPIFGQGLALAPANCDAGGVVASSPWGPATVTPATVATTSSRASSAGASAVTTATDRASAFSPSVSVGFGFAP